ncbi:MAG TPA: TonB-dependent receptor, partial [Verrucomicrobiota bacterium]|nr:TonB-dependent receptor [Verrucomicrobiota bacterium]
FVELGPRIDRVEKDAFRIVPGLRGKLPDSETWSWETAFLYSVERGDNYLLGDVNRTRLRELSTLGTPDAFNPFGFQQSQSVADEVRRDLYIAGETELWSVDARVGGDVFDLPAGGIGVVVGGGYQEDSGESLPDGNLISGDLIGFLGQDPLIGERSISSVFGEIKIPIFSEEFNVPGAYALNVRLQGRYDYYSDFGDTTNPGVKFGWQPFDEFFQIFGSWSTSFRAPTFFDLYTTAQESFPEVRNPYNGDFAQIETTQRGNPNLEPEEADNWTIGGEWRVKQVPGLKLGLTYFRIERENTPGGSAQFIADQIAAQVPNPAPNTYYFTDGSSQSQAPSGAQNSRGWLKTDASDAQVIETMNVPRQNLSSDKLDGFDIDASYDWQTDQFGTFSFAMAWQYLLTYEQEQIPGQGYVDRLGDYSADEFGYESLPRFKGFGSFFWTYDKFSTGFYANYTSSYLDDKLAGVDREVDDYLTFDIQASYEFPYNIKLTLGCPNLTDAAPPLAVASFADRYDRGLNDLRQRFWYVNVGVKF